MGGQAKPGFHYHRHSHFMALFPGPSGRAGARRELLDFVVQGKINKGRHTDHPARRHSIRTNQCPPPPSPTFIWKISVTMEMVTVVYNRCDNYRQNYCEVCVNCRYRRLLRMTTHGLCLWRQLIQKNHRKSFRTLRKTVRVHCIQLYAYMLYNVHSWMTLSNSLWVLRDAAVMIKNVLLLLQLFLCH